MDLSVVILSVVLYAAGVLTGVLITRAVLGVERLSRNVERLADEMETEDEQDRDA